MAPVAAEIMPGRPPAKAMTTAIQKEAYSPTRGSTPAIIENAMASGMSANATTKPASRSLRIFENHSCRSLFMRDQLGDAPDCHGDTAQQAERIVIRTNAPAANPAWVPTTAMNPTW